MQVPGPAELRQLHMQRDFNPNSGESNEKNMENEMDTSTCRSPVLAPSLPAYSKGRSQRCVGAKGAARREADEDQTLGWGPRDTGLLCNGVYTGLGFGVGPLQWGYIGV